VRLSARVEYAVRAALELAAVAPAPMRSDELASAQDVSPSFLVNIMSELRRAGIVRSERGAGGGYRLARPPEEITIADVMRAVQGNLADVHGVHPEELVYPGAAASLRDVWVAARASYRRVLERVSLADVVSGELPEGVADLLADDRAWHAWPAL
jgi:Rrf2 family protein